MPLDLDNLDLDDDVESKKETKVSKPEKSKGKPPSPQSRVKKDDDNPYPKGTVVMFSSDEHDYPGGWVTASRKSRKSYYNLKVEMPDGEEVSVRSTDVKPAGQKSKDKLDALRRKLQEEGEAPEEEEEKNEEDQEDQEEDDAEEDFFEELALAEEKFPVGSKVALAGAKNKGDKIGEVVSQPQVHGKHNYVKVEVKWPDETKLSLVGGLEPWDEDEEEGEEDTEGISLFDDDTDEDVPEERPDHGEADPGAGEDDEASEEPGNGGGDEEPSEGTGDDEPEEEVKQLPMREEPDTPAPEFSEDLQKYVGLTDNLEIAKLIGLPIEFNVDNFGTVVENLRTIIGLPVGSDVQLMAEKIQRDHFWVQSTHAALEWAAKEANTTFESWYASQLSENWNLAREHYAQQMKDYKSKKAEKPLAPSRDVIKDDIKGSTTYLEYRRAVHKIEYWRDVIAKVAVAGHDRKAMLLMSINKTAPQEHVTNRRSSRVISEEMENTGGEIELAENELDELFPKAETEDPANSTEEDPPPISEDRFGGKEKLYPWLATECATEDTCGECDATVYYEESGGTPYNIDKTPHSKTCEGGEQEVRSKPKQSDAGLEDLDLDDDLGFDDDAPTSSDDGSAVGDADDRDKTVETGEDPDNDVDDHDDAGEDDDFLAGLELDLA